MINDCTFNRQTKCAALSTYKCEKCSFRKTKEELEAGRRRAMFRIENLPQDVQRAIDDKYYKKRQETE